MEGISLVQSNELGEPVVGNPEATNSIPASHDFNGHVPGEFLLPVWVLLLPLVSLPDASEPLAGHFLLEDSKLADQTCQAAAGEAAARETKEIDLIAIVVVVHKKIVRSEDVLVDSPA